MRSLDPLRNGFFHTRQAEARGWKWRKSFFGRADGSSSKSWIIQRRRRVRDQKGKNREGSNESSCFFAIATRVSFGFPHFSRPIDELRHDFKKSGFQESWGRGWRLQRTSSRAI